MWTYPQIDPVALQLGPLALRWYGLTYLLAFTAAWALARRRSASIGQTHAWVDDLIFYGALGVVLGGRLGYVFFYQLDRFLADPAYLFLIWEGGMSFHGGLLGVVVALAYLARRSRLPFLAVADFTAPLVPLGLGFGRLGNFMNGELPGRLTEMPWGVVYPGEVLARHPSSLYQAATEGLVLFALLWTLTSRPRPPGFASGTFLLGYGCLRFSTEFFRTPDPHLGFQALGLTQGQWLCLPMILAGFAFLAWGRRGHNARSVI
ncbi:MAG: hypothetical protein RLZZ174_62 [Pseudomonadota bacterium]